MTAECRWEVDLLDAIASGRWPARAETALQEHVAECSLCADVADVAQAFVEERDAAWAESGNLAPARLIWLRAQARARAEDSRAAARPIAIMQALGFAGATGLMSALIGVAAWWVWTRTEWLSAVPWPSDGGLDVMGVAIRGVLLAVGLWLVLAPVAVYLVAIDD